MFDRAAAASPAGAGRDPTELARLFVLSAGREVPTHVREQIAERLGAAEPPDPDLEERVVLHTCHRVELIGVGTPGTGPMATGLALRRGAPAVDHVLRVAAGLDSAVLAEEQLLGQVRDAYAGALARRETGPILNELLRRAIRIGKRSRTMAAPGTDRSLARRALRWAHDAAGPGRALVLGTGETARELATGLALDGHAVQVASRDAGRAAAMAAGLPGSGHAGGVHDAALAGRPWSVIAAATRISAPLLTVADHAAIGSAVVIDLSAPPAVEPALATLLGDALLDLDRLARSGEAVAPPLSAAARRRLETMIAQERDGFARWMEERGSGEAIALLRRDLDALRERHLDRLRRRSILQPGQLAAVDHMTRAMLAELMHVPTTRLRAAGDDAEHLRRLFGLDR